jgi:hypothetical protein
MALFYQQAKLDKDSWKHRHAINRDMVTSLEVF